MQYNNPNVMVGRTCCRMAHKQIQMEHDSTTSTQTWDIYN